MYISLYKNPIKGNQYKIKKSIVIGGSAIVEYSNNIVGIATLNNNVWHIIVASGCELGAKRVANSLKYVIRKDTTTQRRKYSIEERQGEALVVEATITFTK